jgi:hypothetical protein
LLFVPFWFGTVGWWFGSCYLYHLPLFLHACPHYITCMPLRTRHRTCCAPFALPLPATTCRRCHYRTPPTHAPLAHYLPSLTLLRLDGQLRRIWPYGLVYSYRTTIGRITPRSIIAKPLLPLPAVPLTAQHLLRVPLVLMLRRAFCVAYLLTRVLLVMRAIQREPPFLACNALLYAGCSSDVTADIAQGDGLMRVDGLLCLLAFAPSSGAPPPPRRASVLPTAAPSCCSFSGAGVGNFAAFSGAAARRRLFALLRTTFLLVLSPVPLLLVPTC